MKSILGVLQSTSKVDFTKLNNANSKEGQVNILTDYLKQENDSYLGVVQKEWRIIWTDIQTNVRNAVISVKRDFIWDFWREFTVWAKSTAFTRDLKKLEEVDNWIDTEANQHIQNYVFNDPIPQSQYDALKQVFVNNTELFSMVNSWWFSTWVSYKQIIWWLNALNRSIKNHITVTPKRDTKFESTKWINYSLNAQWSKWLAASYDCVKSTVAGNCNPNRSKTNDIAKEFWKSVGWDFDLIMGKFQWSIKKLKQVFSNDYYDSYFDDFGNDRWVRYDGQNLGADAKNAIEPRKEAKEEKNRVKAILDECYVESALGGGYEWERVFSVFNPNGRVITCREVADFQYPVFKNISEAEWAKRKGLLESMNNWVGTTMNSADMLQSYAKVASPLDATKKFPLLSKSVYEAKWVLLELIESSIDWCLAYCSNLNAQVNCGSK